MNQQKKEKKVLFVCYYTPPYGGGAVVRIHNFLRFLSRKNNYKIDVLTIKDTYLPEIYKDKDLIKHYTESVNFVRTGFPFGKKLTSIENRHLETASLNKGSGQGITGRVLKFFKSLMIPDEKMFWIIGGFWTAIRKYNRSDVDCVVSSAPPFSTHVLSAVIARKLKKPLILDYRDLLSLNVFYNSEKTLKYRINRRLERFCLNSASFIIFTNQPAADKMKKSFQIPDSKIRIIENGFEMEDFLKFRKNGKSSSGEFRINYVGSLTKERSPYFFLKATENIIDKFPNLKIEIGFVGYVSANNLEMINEVGKKATVKIYGALKKSEAIEILCNKSELLILFQRNTEGGDTAIPGKVYEYLATGIPVFLMDDPNGATTEFLKSLGITTISEYENQEQIQNTLEYIFTRYEELKEHSEKIQQGINHYSRESQTEKLNDLIMELIN
jgi:glycosyltransferase involved in cell wall biosynthesis